MPYHGNKKQWNPSQYRKETTGLTTEYICFSSDRPVVCSSKRYVMYELDHRMNCVIKSELKGGKGLDDRFNNQSVNQTLSLYLNSVF